MTGEMWAETAGALQSETSHFAKARKSLLEPDPGLKGQVPNGGNNTGGLSSLAHVLCKESQRRP